ncbi:MAG: glutaminyl-peptide cyclotransferase [Cytophagaceae bacterium]|nr:glutaminyl-peptide cyclotransferase [Cytophagaceae bacterium]
MKNTTLISEKMSYSSYAYLLVFSSFIIRCDFTKNESQTETDTPSSQNIAYQIVGDFPHDTTSFTEGFLIHNGELWESGGGPEEIPLAKSMFGTVNRETGKVNIKVELEKKVYFGEGICILNNNIYQLTYKNQKGFVYDLKTLKKIKEFAYANTEGWGLTTDGKSLIMTDGTYEITFLDPESLSVIKKLAVKENGYAIDKINEPEWVNGFIFANIWMTNTIVKIDPANGQIVAKADLGELASRAKNQYAGSMEMNGIAFDSGKNQLLVTGKLWPKIFVLQL